MWFLLDVIASVEYAEQFGTPLRGHGPYGLWSCSGSGSCPDGKCSLSEKGKKLLQKIVFSVKKVIQRHSPDVNLL